VANTNIVYNAILNSGAERYFDKDSKPLFENNDSTIRKAWDVAVKAARWSPWRSS
jgi:cellobiose transport system substrate-binding protein